MAFYDEKDWREMFRLRRAIVRAEQSLSEIDREILPHGLCESDVAILERLARKGARPVNGLARQVGLTSGSMTSAVKRLHRRGLVETKRRPKRSFSNFRSFEGRPLRQYFRSGLSESAAF